MGWRVSDLCLTQPWPAMLLPRCRLPPTLTLSPGCHHRHRHRHHHHHHHHLQSRVRQRLRASSLPEPALGE
ncbi:hypothetical protein BBK36DRAFT_1136773 [Trichoderma citrinoviride]|uniref:Uncharacterized protein n=1 Tax=Trichoderma citrinoviride TaxID=58853 RepID=A0A2T4AWE7_9HYPO|nr:hypothetical protein BBK36DRAFT_1136773 [Trichoderma citrinoviride]PTB61392.1 hypothetical protein BBK36DRAFT_1136773 [Trichoderma citrinoviride]